MGAALLIFVELAPAPVRAEAVFLKNGQQVSGAIRSETTEFVTVNRHGQNVVIRRTDIERIDREDVSYYMEEYAQALEAGDNDRVRRLFDFMKRHLEPEVRRRGAELEEIFLSGGDLPVWDATDLEKASLEELYERYHSAIDRVRWEEAQEIGRVIIRRHHPPVSFFPTMLEAHKNTENDTHFLLTDAYRLFLYGDSARADVSQVYLASAFEKRILELWNVEEPSRTDAETYVSLLARGLVLSMNDLRNAPEEIREEIATFLGELAASNDWDYATRSIPEGYALILFAGSTHAREELVPVFRYFALLKEKEILAARVRHEVMEDPVREARATYIYTISNIIPLPKEKLWSSARELALIGRSEPPLISDIVSQVFLYTPGDKHPQLAMAYEELLTGEALGRKDFGEGLVRALELIAKQRAGSDFDRERSWAAFQGLAALRRGAGRDGEKIVLTVSDTIGAALGVASEYEREKVCLMYEDRLLVAAESGEYGEGLLEAAQLLARRRAIDSSDPDTKWRAFSGLALLRREEFGGRREANGMSTTEVLATAFSAAPAGIQSRLSILFEDRILEAVGTERGLPLREAVEHIATHRGRDLSDPEASWRAFEALASVTFSAAEPAGQAPATSRVFDAAFAVMPSHRYGEVAVKYEDRIRDAVEDGKDRERGLRRAVELLAEQRLQSESSTSTAVWRAVELKTRFLYGEDATEDDVLAMMEELTGGAPNRRLRAIEVINVHFAGRIDNPVYRHYRDRWAETLIKGIDQWISSTARAGSDVPLTVDISDTALGRSPELREALGRMHDHGRLLASLDAFEEQMRTRYRPGRNVLSDNAASNLVGSLNSFWKESESRAVRDRLVALIEDCFDESARLVLLENGLMIGERPQTAAVSEE